MLKTRFPLIEQIKPPVADTQVTTVVSGPYPHCTRTEGRRSKSSFRERRSVRGRIDTRRVETPTICKNGTAEGVLWPPCNLGPKPQGAGAAPPPPKTDMTDGVDIYVRSCATRCKNKIGTVREHTFYGQFNFSSKLAKIKENPDNAVKQTASGISKIVHVAHFVAYGGVVFMAGAADSHRP
ncbi:hypothetical protein EVAR_8061_1 [Eumeta japonica]|uniref:Uncharacterized protein n=1 Tax=Eumeta variegata TaxID=151549 RepID=A0A4C1TKL3_EUMVA|nr:hypothetical protein EVAR_8061_1 [Eumeta japonica]